MSGNNGDNQNNQPPQSGDAAVNILPPGVKAQIVINLFNNGQVIGNGPTDMKVLCYMIGAFITSVGQMAEYKPPSKIIRPFGA